MRCCLCFHLLSTFVCVCAFILPSRHCCLPSSSRERAQHRVAFAHFNFRRKLSLLLAFCLLLLLTSLTLLLLLPLLLLLCWHFPHFAPCCAQHPLLVPSPPLPLPQSLLAALMPIYSLFRLVLCVRSLCLSLSPTLSHVSQAREQCKRFGS